MMGTINTSAQSGVPNDFDEAVGSTVFVVEVEFEVEDR